jgi:phosphocarrier protein HPr
LIDESKIMNDFTPTSQTVVIVNRLGMHARAAARFAQLSDQFNATATIEKDGAVASSDSIMEMMMLTAGLGDKVKITTTGPESTAALKALIELIQKGFGEDVIAPEANRVLAV